MKCWPSWRFSFYISSKPLATVAAVITCVYNTFPSIYFFYCSKFISKFISSLCPLRHMCVTSIWPSFWRRKHPTSRTFVNQYDCIVLGGWKHLWSSPYVNVNIFITMYRFQWLQLISWSQSNQINTCQPKPNANVLVADVVILSINIR